MNKKIFILAAICVFAASGTAHAGFDYITNADGSSITITGYAGLAEVIIPLTINNLTVTDIGETAFFNTDITSVIIPTDVTNIGAAAFEDCANLTNAILPVTLVRIGDDAFSSSALTTITIPKSVAYGGDSSFAGCENLTNISFEFGLIEIQTNMFLGCNSLETVVIPASITNIDDSAFGNCDSLTNIFFIGNAPAVGELAFAESRPPEEGVPWYYIATAYYLPGTTGWDQFESSTLLISNEWHIPTNIFVPAVLWNPTIQATSTNFGVQNGQYGFDITGTTNLPIAIEASDDVAQGNWTVLQRLTLTNGLYHFSEPFQSNTPSRFYRIGFP